MANAAAPRNMIGNASDISPNPLTSSWSAALDGCSALVITSSAPADRIADAVASVADWDPSGPSQASAWPWTAAAGSAETSDSGANRTPKSSGRTNTSWRLLASQMYSGEKTVPSTLSSRQLVPSRIWIVSPGLRWKLLAMCCSTSTPLGIDGSSRVPSSTRTSFTGAGLPSSGNPTARPSSCWSPTLIGTSATDRVEVARTSGTAATAAATLAGSPPTAVMSAKCVSV